jgi:hypothetical protein
VLLIAAFALAQALPGQANGRISRHGSTAGPGVSDGGPPGGANAEVQYNKAGTFGGIANVTSDGTHERYAPEYAEVAPPDGGSLEYDFAQQASMPQTQVRIDSVLALPTPWSFLTPGEGAVYSTPDMVHMECHFPDGTAGGGGNLLVNVGTNTNTNQFGATGGISGWDAGSNIRKHRHAFHALGSTVNTWTGITETTSQEPLVMSLGFVAWERWSPLIWDGKTAWAMYMGWGDTSGAPSGTVQPSAQTNTFYFGCDDIAAQVNLQICSNDAAGTATCVDVGPADGGDPFTCRGVEYTFDGWFWGAPNEAVVHWLLSRTNGSGVNPTWTGGTLASDLPQATKQLIWRGMISSGADSGATTAGNVGFAGVCEWVGY